MVENQNNLKHESELDKLFDGLTDSQKIFIISQEERVSNNPLVKQKFTQGTIVNNLTLYLDELNLHDGPTQCSTSRYDDSDSDSDSNSDIPTKPPSFYVA